MNAQSRVPVSPHLPAAAHPLPGRGHRALRHAGACGRQRRAPARDRRQAAPAAAAQGPGAVSVEGGRSEGGREDWKGLCKAAGVQACDAPPRVCTCTVPGSRLAPLTCQPAFVWLFRCLQAGGGVQVGHQGGSGPVPGVVLRGALSDWHVLLILCCGTGQYKEPFYVMCSLLSAAPISSCCWHAAVGSRLTCISASHFLQSSHLPLSWANSSIDSLCAALYSGATSPRRTASARSARRWRARVSAMELIAGDPG